MISVYLDNCCYNRPYDDQEQPKVQLETQAKLHVQKMITDKKLNLVYSYVSEYENSNNPNGEHSLSISQFFANAAVYVDYSRKDDVLAETKEITETGVKEMDALHVASAIIGKADYFLTVDKRLLKYSTEKINIMNPVDFISNVEV
ncbi:MAG: hypothetical protein NC253_09835 [Ruminococcus sp.]|nr:hypothetical protein [Ruminococcus sp.]MCM1381216.1 hypothetical protein [Muribaculaceae bacterium]MCM1478429.1 hypothetical protein [Muribaculaceae bacterium]